jgi:hypothetical protein
MRYETNNKHNPTMFTAQLIGRIEFSSFTEMPQTPTTPETSLLEFVVHCKGQPRLSTPDSWVTCRITGPRTVGLLDHLFMGVGVFVDGSLEVVPFIDEQTGVAQARTILNVERLFITAVPSRSQND